MAYKKICAACGEQAIKGGLCQIHYSRWWKNGTFDTKRPADWGQRSKHPMWERWKGLRKRGEFSPQWLDFWRFVADVGEPPAARSALIQVDYSKPIGPQNFEWRPFTNDFSTREARAAYAKAWRERHPGHRAKAKLSRYGLSLEQYDEMLQAQGAHCALCGCADQRGLKLAVDHCHTTGVVRGLLCTHCNTAIGLLKDDPDLIEKAAEYVRAHLPPKEKVA